MKKFKYLTHYLPLFLWLVIIFMFSNQVADSSNTMSLGISRTFYNFLLRFNIDQIFSYDSMHHLIRKLAHFTVYFILGILVIRVFNKPITLSKIIQAVFICFLYACTDEVHQHFNPGRSMSFKDVVIDTVGSFFGIIMFQVFLVKILNPIMAKKKMAQLQK